MKDRELLFNLIEKQIQNYNYDFYFIEEIEDINMQDKYGDTLLHKCAEYNNITFAKLLLDMGANHNIKNNYGKYPYHVAALNGYCELFILLFTRRDINKYELTNNKEDILHLIYSANNVNYLDEVVYKNRENNDLSIKDRYGKTILSTMIFNNNYDRFILGDILHDDKKHIYYYYKKDNNYNDKTKKKVLEKMIFEDYILGKTVVYEQYQAIYDFIELSKTFGVNINKVKNSVINYITKHRQENIKIYVDKPAYKFFLMNAKTK